MADRLRDRAPDGRGAGDPPKAVPPRQPERGSGQGRGSGNDTRKAESAPSERRKAETEIAAGDVADDLADFA